MLFSYLLLLLLKKDAMKKSSSILHINFKGKYFPVSQSANIKQPEIKRNVEKRLLCLINCVKKENKETIRSKRQDDPKKARKQRERRKRGNVALFFFDV
jgi:hypothetical protein